MGYVEELRKLVGHRRVILCGSSVVIRNDRGEVAHIRLPQSFPDLFERINGPEPLIPFREYKEDGSFFASAPYDFVSLAISPRYAPKAADELVPVFRAYMRL